jgi:NitT/TauT family transport system substrate-binding protein
MNIRRDGHWSRREFLTNLSLAGGAALLGLQSDVAAAEPPPETTKLRLIRSPAICQAPQSASGELLRSEGFTDVQEVRTDASLIARIQAVGAGEGDIISTYVPPPHHSH